MAAVNLFFRSAAELCSFAPSALRTTQIGLNNAGDMRLGFALQKSKAGAQLCRSRSNASAEEGRPRSRLLKVPGAIGWDGIWRAAAAVAAKVRILCQRDVRADSAAWLPPLQLPILDGRKFALLQVSVVAYVPRGHVEGARAPPGPDGRTQKQRMLAGDRSAACMLDEAAPKASLADIRLAAAAFAAYALLPAALEALPLPVPQRPTVGAAQPAGCAAAWLHRIQARQALPSDLHPCRGVVQSI